MLGVRLIIISIFTCSITSSGAAQTSSLAGRQREAEAQRAPEAKPRVEGQNPAPATKVIESNSWIAIKPPPPRMFKVHDLVTIIVREQRTFEADAELETEKKYEIQSDLEAFLKLTQGGLGASKLHRGAPNINYSFENGVEGEADTKREDRMTTRVQAQIIDVKPNGLLVLEARKKITHDEEVSLITVTGVCRKEDITADNSILSTQIANSEIKVVTEGALHDNATRGWIPKLLDKIKPF